MIYFIFVHNVNVHLVIHLAGYYLTRYWSRLRGGTCLCQTSSVDFSPPPSPPPSTFSGKGHTCLKLLARQFMYEPPCVPVTSAGKLSRNHCRPPNIKLLFSPVWLKSGNYWYTGWCRCVVNEWNTLASAFQRELVLSYIAAVLSMWWWL